MVHFMGLLAQLVERGADNAKVVSSSLTQTNVFINVFHYFSSKVIYISSSKKYLIFVVYHI